MIFLFGKEKVAPLAADVVLKKIPAKVVNRFLSSKGGEDYIVVPSPSKKNSFNVSSRAKAHTSILVLEFHKGGLFSSDYYLAITAKEYKSLAKKAVSYVLERYS